MSLERIIRVDDETDRFSLIKSAYITNTRLPSVNPSCEAIVVIPVYSEFKNGRIIALLDELQNQSVGLSRFETILVVNSDPSIYNQHGLEGHLDNKQLLESLKQLQNTGKFSNVDVLDCTNGQLGNRHMGVIRGFGNQIAENRLTKTNRGDKGIIIQLDADVSVTSSYIERLLDAYKDPAVLSAIVGRIPLPIDYDSADYYLFFARRFAKCVLHALDNSVSGGPEADGPTISFRAYLHKVKQLRFYMVQSINEDFTLGQGLYIEGGLHLLLEPRVYKGDRTRDEGFDSANRNIWVKKDSEFTTSWGIAKDLLKAILEGKAFADSQFRVLPQADYWAMVDEHLKETKPEIADKFKECLAKEEELARKSLDWDKLDKAFRDPALHYYAYSRLIYGERKSLPFV